MNAETLMKRITYLLLAVAGVVAYMAHATEEAAPIFLTEIPQGYRDLSLISVSRLTASNGSLTCGVSGRAGDFGRRAPNLSLLQSHAGTAQADEMRAA